MKTPLKVDEEQGENHTRSIQLATEIINKASSSHESARIRW